MLKNGKRNYRDLYENTYIRMLVDDVSHSIVPYGGESRREGFTVRLVPEGADVEKQVVDGLGQRNESRNLAAATCYFIQECAMFIMLEGQVHYEIVYHERVEGSGRKSFKLEFIPPWSIKRRRGKLVQMIPQEVAVSQGCPTTVVLGGPDIVTFSSSIIDPARNMKTLETLARVGEGVLPEFYMRDLAQAGKASPFELKEFERAQKATVATVTKEYGWTARGLLQECMSEYYFFVRFLRFEMLKAIMREDIVRTLNQALGRAGDVLGFEAAIVIEGLPSNEDVSRSSALLQEGKSEFKVIMDPYLKAGL